MPFRVILHSPIGQIKKCWHETDAYLGSPSHSGLFRGLEINNYVGGFGYLVKYWVADLGIHDTRFVSRGRHSDFSFIEGT